MRVMPLLFFLLAVLSVDNYINAQPSVSKYKVMVTVANESGTPLQDVIISLLRAKDSAMVKTILTDKSGKAELENLKEGNYKLSSSIIGYAKNITPVFTLNEARPSIARDIILQSISSGQLKDVTVSAKKPFIERQFDKLVVNVEGSIVASGGSAMEVLERSPGIMIDQNDNINMKGKSGTIVMIDGRISPLSGQDLANFLKGLPANAIEKIELITNPSARYDAAGTAGMINIKMKKDQRLGTNGTFSMGAGYGIYGRHNEGINMNHRNKKINLFGNYNFAQRKQYVNLSLQRRFFDALTDTITGGFDQVTDAQQPITNHTARVGLDFFPSKKTIMGVVLSGVYNNQGRHYVSNAKALNAKETTDSTFTTLTNSNELLKNYSVNFNLKHTLDSTGRDLSVDMDYGRYKSDMDPRLGITYYDLGGSVKGTPYQLLGISKGLLSIYSLKADYIHPFKKSGRMELGLKSSYVKADNDLVFRQVVNNVSTYDSSRSNHFIYEENINAAYINVNRSWKKFDVQVGLRAEQTNIKGNQVTTKQVFDSSYIRLFPSAVMNYTIGKKDIISVSVSRRIGRPGYNQLNPFKYFIDPTSYRTGNVGLQPQFTYSYELSYTHGQTFATLSYSKTRNNIAGVIMPVKEGNMIYSVETTGNLSTVHNFGISITSAIKLARWWNTQNSLDAYYNKFVGNIGNTSLNQSAPLLNMSNNSSFIIGKGWTAEAVMSYRMKQRIGYSTYGAIFRFAAGIQKTILNKNGTLRLNVTDLFWSDIANNNSSFNIYRQDYQVIRNTRIVSVAFTYRFGKNTVARARNRTGGAEEEKSRAN